MFYGREKPHKLVCEHCRATCWFRSVQAVLCLRLCLETPCFVVPGRRCFEFDFRLFVFSRDGGDVFDVCAFLLTDFFFVLCSL